MKKIFSLICSAVIFISACSVCAFAADNVIAFTSDVEVVHINESFGIQISVGGDNEFNTIGVADFLYDENVFEFSGFSAYDDGLLGELLLPGITPDDENMAITLPFKESITYNGNICTAFFKVKDNAAAGEYSISAKAVIKNDSNVIFSQTVAVQLDVKDCIASGVCGEDAVWMLDTDGTLIVDGVGKIDDFYPYDVPWKENIEDVKKIIVNEGIVKIGKFSFNNCVNCLTADLPDSLEVIADAAFQNCSKLDEINIPDNVTHIYKAAFNRCYSVKTVKIPQSVEYIGLAVFGNCHSLKLIEVDENNPFYSNDSAGVLYDKTIKTIIQYPVGNDKTSYSLPESVEIVFPQAFFGSRNLQVIKIGQNVSDIRQFAFSNTFALEKIVVDNGNMYYSCDELGALYNKDKTLLMKYPVANVLEVFEIPYSVTSIDDAAFLGAKNLSFVKIPDSITHLQNYTFQGCTNLETIVIPDTVVDIENNTFLNCPKLTIYGFENSYVNEFAAEQNLPFDFLYSVKYDSDGSFTVPNRQLKLNNIDLTITREKPKKSGFRFLGWSTLENGEVEYKPLDVISENKDLLLFAVWEEKTFIDGDINTDGTFNYYDVSRLYAIYRGKASNENNADIDINGDGTFNYYDVSRLYAIYRGKVQFDN